MREIVERLREIEREQEKRRREDRLASYNAGEKKTRKAVGFS